MSSILFVCIMEYNLAFLPQPEKISLFHKRYDYVLCVLAGITGFGATAFGSTPASSSSGFGTESTGFGGFGSASNTATVRPLG